MNKYTRRIIGGVLCFSLLAAMSACGNKQDEQASSTKEETPVVEILDVPEEELMRSVPEDYTGDGGVFQMASDTLDTDTTVMLYSAKLKCSDGVERVSWSLEKNAVYLSNEESKEHTDGIVSSSDNITLMSYVATREGATVGEIMDAITEQEAKKAENGSFMVSDTVECKTNVFLTDYLISDESNQSETFYILNILDDNTVQIYTVTRTYDESVKDIDAATADTSDLVKYFLASSDSRDVFCGVIQAILKKM